MTKAGQVRLNILQMPFPEFIEMRWIPVILAVCISVPAAGQPAHQLFGSHKVPSNSVSASFGSYAKGCLSGGKLLQETTSGWQAMRLSRNRNWGHPEMISFIERLSRKAQKIGWPRLYVGDIGQPRGGPMKSGHRSHQTGLDVDIWLRMPGMKKLSRAERERIGSHVVVAKDGVNLNQYWTPSHHQVIQAAAEDPAVARIFVNAAIKRAMCQDEMGDQGQIDAPWLRKVRPWRGHNAHFHVRLACPHGSPGCRDQPPPPPGTGCGAELSKWFPKNRLSRSLDVTRRYEEEQRSAQSRTRAAKKTLTIEDLPKVCLSVLGEDDAEISVAIARVEPEPEPEVTLPIFSGGSQRAHDGFVGTRYFWRPQIDLNAARLQAVNLRVAGALPPGLKFSDRGGGNALLSGTPTQPGEFNFEIIAEKRGEERGRQKVFLPVAALNTAAATQQVQQVAAVKSLDHKVRDFLTDFIGDECFWAQPEQVSSARINIEAYSDDPAPFYDFDSAFKAAIGIEANIGGRMVRPPQCAALAFARYFPGGGADKIGMDDPDRIVQPGQIFQLSLADRPGRSMTLLVIDPNGLVFDLTPSLSKQNGRISTSLRAAIPGPHLLLALDSAAGLGQLPQSGPAETVFASLSKSEALRGADLRSSLAYFVLQ